MLSFVQFRFQGNISYGHKIFKQMFWNILNILFDFYNTCLMLSVADSILKLHLLPVSKTLLFIFVITNSVKIVIFDNLLNVFLHLMK